MVRKIVCAAIKHKQHGIVVCGVRHFDKIMGKAIMFIDSIGPVTKSSDWEQGFVDSYGDFLNRKDALIRTRECNQELINTDKSWFKDELYSENLY